MKMAAIGEVSEFVEEIAFLESMFGGTVSATVIGSVIESCGGNVHLAADAIMNFSDVMSTTELENAAIESKDDTNVTSLVNVEAPPFEFVQLPTNAENQSLETSTSARLQSPTSPSHQSPKAASQQLQTSANMQVPAITQSRPQSQTIAKQLSHLPPSPQSSTSSKQQEPATETQEPAPSVNQQPYPLMNQQTISSKNQQPPANIVPVATVDAHLVSFSETFRHSGTIPKKPPDTKFRKPLYKIEVSPDEISKILQYHNEGTRTLILLRGPSGSGKTYLAKHIVEYTVGPSSENYANHIFSSDSFFMKYGVYTFHRGNLDQAHAMNQRRVCDATNKGMSPVIVDNTNTELWEMEPYIRDGVRNGYIMVFLEPNTSWARNVNQLANRNVHGVPRESIRRMLDRFEKNITPEKAMKTLRLSYSSNKQPPVPRNIPTFSSPRCTRNSPRREKPNKNMEASQDITQHKSQNCVVMPSNYKEIHVSGSENTSIDDDPISIDEHSIKIIEEQQKIEQFQKAEQEWENGESWDVATETNNNKTQSVISLSPKPARSNEKNNKNAEKLIEPSVICNDWTKISMFMPPWQNSNMTNTIQTKDPPSTKVISVNVATCFEIGDLNEQMHKIMYGVPQDINKGIPEKMKPKFPRVMMFDKSTCTNENNLLSKKEVCKNKEIHFKELRRMFQLVPRVVLRDIFENCNCDVEWAVDLVLDSYSGIQKFEDYGNVSDSEEDEGEVAECNCLAGYNIIPDITTISENMPVPEPEPSPPSSTLVLKKKTKRDSKLSDVSLQLKRQIEGNVMISEHHYSHNYLNMRRLRENNIDGSERERGISQLTTEDVAQVNISGLESEVVENAIALPEVSTQPQNSQNSIIPTIPNDFWDVAGPSTSYNNLQSMDADPIDSDIESDSNNSDFPEVTVPVNIGRDFVVKLDELFGRKDFLYPGDVEPVVDLPMSLLQQINAHWAMSVASQLDDRSIQTEAMIKQDEDFARELAAKEQRMIEEGKESEVPSLKEIIEMETTSLAKTRSVSEWRDNEPQDFAAKLSRQKLYNLFPTMKQDTLSQILMAHHYCFKKTIESLLISTAQAKWLTEDKGIEKFILQKEMLRKDEFLQEQNKGHDKGFLADSDKPITLETVNFFRDEAESALRSRNMYFEKARLFFSRNCTEVASFYSGMASLNTRKYEHLSFMAATYQMKFHQKNNPNTNMLDLHYLRVPEAMVVLDIYIDQNIAKLRSANNRCKVVWIITGKGSHSIGKPRIKPATKRRLKERGIIFDKINEGLFKASLYRYDKLSNELLDVIS